MKTRQRKARLRKFFYSVGFSVVVLIILIGLLAYSAYNVTQSFEEEVDFGGVYTIRQSTMSGKSEQVDDLKLSRQMILDCISQEKVLNAVASRYNWDATPEEILQCIDISKRLADQNSYVIMVNSNNIQRSNAIAKELSYYFLSEYQKKWRENSQHVIETYEKEIEVLSIELDKLKQLKKRFAVKEELRPLSTDVEIMSINEQLLAAQSQFLVAYSAFITRLEDARFQVEMELTLAKEMNTDKSILVKSLQRKLDVMTAKCDEVKKSMDLQAPEIYKMDVDYPPLTGFPNDIVYFYENIKKLQQLKLALLLDEIIEEKELKLNDFKKNKNTIESLFDSDSCDVFIREVN